MGLLELFVAASIPVLKVLLITGLGTYLALDRVSILGDEARKHVNNLVFYIYNPALVASNLAKTITYDSMIKLWFMPFNILITFIIGSILGWIVILFTRPPLHLRGLIVGCCAAGNMGNMLFIIIPAICKEKGSPFGSPDACHSYGMAYSSLSMAIGAIYLWSYVYNIVRMSSIRSIVEPKTNNSSNGKSFRGTSTSELESCTEPLLPSEHVHQCILPCTRSDAKAEVSVSNKIKQQLRMVFENINWKLLFAPSTIGVIVGFAVGLIPQIRKLMVGDAAPLRVIQNSTSLLGDGAIPTTTLIVGGNLLKGLRGPGIQKSLIISIVAARYIALPLIGILVVKGALHLGLLQADPLYQFILLLQFAVPPAMNIGTMTQLFGAGESECSVIMLWTYALASISLTLWSTFFMWLVA
ncbi:putative Auxin efflux carrier family protein [Tripterygium wilfordii]|uniref:Putative Auxin efflux carrier family protein n=1 Tax=Tripterygium wilfordii TaxID=458696 RepID=A0A7J7D3S7_TRIWF|nr:protein PIN-LIKES 3-like [Tripterygium wilfordii]XP_038715889.1 protein PIN-LIKES 3-like [Tripterygium wilfordii]KAF5740990.1 putative Auxin efflux carrier family protein [Tripterygium wilfordii]